MQVFDNYCIKKALDINAVRFHLDATRLNPELRLVDVSLTACLHMAHSQDHSHVTTQLSVNYMFECDSAPALPDSIRLTIARRILPSWPQYNMADGDQIDVYIQQLGGYHG